MLLCRPCPSFEQKWFRRTGTCLDLAEPGTRVYYFLEKMVEAHFVQDKEDYPHTLVDWLT